MAEQQVVTPLEDATIMDSLLFRFLMEREDLCKEFLELALEVKIKSLILPQDENDDALYERKFALMVADFVDVDGVEYSVGFRTLDEVPERLNGYARRYLQEVGKMRARCGIHFSEIKSYSVFLCQYDPFDGNLSKYTIGMKCEDDDIWLNGKDIFLNASGERKDISPELANFLDFVAGRPVEDSFVGQVQKAIAELKQDATLRAKYEQLAPDII